MSKFYRVGVATAAVLSISACTQMGAAPQKPLASSEVAPAKPHMTKKRICEDTTENPYSRVSNHVCRTVEVPAQSGSAGQPHLSR